MYKLYELKKLMEDEFPDMNFKYLDMKFLPDLCKAVSNRAYGLGGNSGTFAMGLSFFLRQFRIDSQFVVATDKQYTEDDVIHGQCTILHCGLMVEDQYSMIFDANGMTNQEGFTEYCMKTFHNDCPYFYIFDTKEYVENIPDIIRYGTKYSVDVGRYYDIFNEEYIKLEKSNKLVRESKLFERLFKEIPDEIYHDILETTGNYVHGNLVTSAMTKWVCNQYLKGNLKGVNEEHLHDYLTSLNHGYSLYKHKLKPIMNYNSIQELEDAILNIINSGYKSKSDLDKLAKKGSKVVYEDNNYLVIKINDYMAARKYGKNTRWCISSNLYSSTFDDYNENDDCYFIIDKKNNNKKYACVDGRCWDEYDDLIFAIDEHYVENLSDELYWRIEESPELYNILPLAFPQYSKEEIQNQIKHVLKNRGYELPINESFTKEDIKKYNKLLKNYVIRANKQLPNGIKISDELMNEVLEFWKKKNKDYSHLTKMDIIYRCPPTISKKWIKKYKDLGVKYNPQN